MNHDHSQPDRHEPGPESRHGDEDDRSPHSGHHGRTHQNHQAAWTAPIITTKSVRSTPITTMQRSITVVNMTRDWGMAAVVIIMVIMLHNSGTGSG